ncbi:glycine C-acetyltransferase [Ornithobacterium rhinotracheale]|uniref:2-amino-3-ketobutyrate coenzyme A ligase n=1 Tax=Ornithobacterium rhinotracheale (strain ATCC 51463 / DSM 15997 / CCUG 23171 / CIP 104009 / LMG 9086) TaxID=867902 RepID=I3ZYC8_ORNRL|nr:glycine C-acetyltransferase [Ornithobacterium rhinotracheale]AFL96712.1 2-amino-3-ketobutyrate coenzyme A ligase [Ornithobacterium rhinotracheale DSM 15997]AIP99501.1 2-amino-3-ketobutyrate CoA ligase [Ornithobacterium rhinotracheale ORT-UMN 88]KGB66514.1 2-amino-3-ketobutyrate CoA ligase [Ornithobacterium rhinotracheale H06-030791]MBN3662509.1 glycine C-acetyltransferase [Ornithobacterium rhinotracheale]MCK0194061.1 glycine C-acetyltransferase [Ornithobacterium rhinotracheale]
MYNDQFKAHLQSTLDQIKDEGLYKRERIIVSQQAAEITLENGSKLLNFCANNYLGLSNNPRVMKASQQAIDSHGYGMSSVRFICGTQDIHKQLEDKISKFLGTEDTILYAACFDANGGVFEPLLTAEDAIISDELNHASIIDGVRLCKAMRYRYKNNNMEDLEAQLKAADEAGARFKLIVTDGVFSMDGIVANLKGVCDLAEKYNALVMVDDSHATGFIGKTGRGTHEANGVMGRVDIITSTLGKALGGALGGFTSGKKEIIDLLRQRSRPYLFSNSLAPGIVGAAIEVLDMLTEDTSRRDKVMENAEYFRKEMKAKGFDIPDGDAAIVPVMLYDAKLSQEMADKLLDEGIYVIGFFYPVVPKGKARIRVQLSAGHTKAHLDKAIAAFEKVGKELGVI